MRYLAAALLLMCGLFAATVPAAARVGITVDLTSQTMHVTSGSGEHYSWSVSTARGGFATPRGTYRPTSLQTMHYSRKYHMSPMPHSIFFRGGYAIHGTYETRALGRPASHGCVRLAPGNAARLFSMVRAEGATITIVGTAPGGTRLAAHRTHHRTQVAHRTTHADPLAYAPANTAHPLKTWLRAPGLR